MCDTFLPKSLLELKGFGVLSQQTARCLTQFGVFSPYMYRFRETLKSFRCSLYGVLETM